MKNCWNTSKPLGRRSSKQCFRWWEPAWNTRRFTMNNLNSALTTPNCSKNSMALSMLSLVPQVNITSAMSTQISLWKLGRKGRFLFSNHKKNRWKWSNQAAVEPKTQTWTFPTASSQFSRNLPTPASCSRTSTMNRSKFTTNTPTSNLVNARTAPKSIRTNASITSAIAKCWSFASNATATSTSANSHSICWANARTRTCSPSAGSAGWLYSSKKATSTSAGMPAAIRRASIGNAASFAARTSSQKISFGSNTHINADIYPQGRNILPSNSRLNDRKFYSI